MIAQAAPADGQIQQEFKALLPELSNRFHCRFYENGPDLQDEYTAEAIAWSWSFFRAARLKNQHPTAANLAYYAIRTVLAGRRQAGCTSTDAMSNTPLSRERLSPVRSFSDMDMDDDAFTFYRVFGDRRWRWPLLEYVATNLDWQQFLGKCSPRDRRIVAMRQKGYQQVEIAARLRISAPAVNQRLKHLRSRWESLAAV
jgi:DNA-directed RNA polymerase specialized sigma24 family protein